MASSRIRRSLPFVGYLALAAGLAATLPGQGQPETEKPWRIQSLIGDDSWFHASGEIRLRWEGLDGQFRPLSRLDNSDHYAVLRTSLRMDADFDPVGVTVELLDARHFGAGEGSVMNRSIVNPIDFLQANVKVDLDEYGDATVGRMTQDVGSRRLIARNRFRNTINAFDGVWWSWRNEDGMKAHAFWTLPVFRNPLERRRLLDNEPELDEQDIDDQFYGAWFGAPVADDIEAEVYMYVVDEKSIALVARNHYTPGLRVRRDPAKESWDFEAEAAFQFGDSSLLLVGPELDHAAWFGHASVGYTFDAPWSPRVGVAYDYASGDRDPNDNENNRFDTLFGARRFEYGPTGIYGAVARANLSSPELRVTAKPTGRSQAMLALRGVWLAEARDFWVPAGVIDPSGSAGRHVGEQIEARYRYDLLPQSVRLEVGGAYLIAGSFQKNAPNGQGKDTAYGYVQVSWRF